MLLQTKERTKAWNSQIPWQRLRVGHHDISFLLLVGDKKYAFFKVLVECRMKGVMGVVYVSKSELKNRIHGKKMKSAKGE